jgi:hypothetical protein
MKTPLEGKHKEQGEAKRKPLFSNFINPAHFLSFQRHWVGSLEHRNMTICFVDAEILNVPNDEKYWNEKLKIISLWSNLSISIELMRL